MKLSPEFCAPFRNRLADRKRILRLDAELSQSRTSTMAFFGSPP
jgi:hypothetical protein